MGIKNIFLIRHAQSQANVDLSVYKEVADHAVPLSDLGHIQAQAAGLALAGKLSGMLDPLERVRIWTSPYMRTRQTAKHIHDALTPSFKRLDQREHINLCEQQFGLFDGVPDEELPQRFPVEHEHYALAERHEGRFWARMPLGESRFDVAVRVHQAFGTFHRDAQKHDVRNLVIVCHGVTLRAFVMQWLHLPYEWFEKQRNPGNCSIYHIDTESDCEGRYIYTSSC